MIRFILVALLVLTPTLASNAGDWTQFKGPNASGVSSEKDLPIEWSKDKGIKWKAPLPARGVSSPVVSGNKLYSICASA